MSLDQWLEAEVKTREEQTQVLEIEERDDALAPNRVILGDCLEVLKTFPDNHFDSVVTDPPYFLINESGSGFMGKGWDSLNAIPKLKKNLKDLVYTFHYSWAGEVFRVLKPGGHLLSFGGSRTYHRLTCGLEDAGFEIRDMVAWIYGCLSEDTEILTTKGWKAIDEIQKGDEVFSFDYGSNRLRRNRVVINKVDEVYKYWHDGEMVRLKNDNTDQLLTKNHKVLCRSQSREQKNGNRKRYWSNKDYRYIDAGFIIAGNYYKLPLGAIYDGDKSVGCKLFAELLGWVLSEGWYQGSAVNISQCKKENVSRIRYILGKLKAKYSEYRREREYNGKKYEEFQFYITGDVAEKIQGILPDKRPTFDLLHLPLGEKEHLFKGLMDGDGSWSHKTFYQKDEDFLEWFQIFCHLMGKQARINKNKMCVSFHDNPETEIQAKHLKNKTGVYSGCVWCINTNIGNFFARRNGKIFITGNSGFPKSLDISKAIDREKREERNEVLEISENTRDRQNHHYTSVGNFGSKTIEITKPVSKKAKEWEGYGTSLKPAIEPICLARKPIAEKNVARNVLKWGVGGLNVDAGRINIQDEKDYEHNCTKNRYKDWWVKRGNVYNIHISGGRPSPIGRFPSNVILDEETAKLLDKQSGFLPERKGVRGRGGQIYASGKGFTNTLAEVGQIVGYGDEGGCSRFFYVAKAGRGERFGYCKNCEKVIPQENWENHKQHDVIFHVTVKPLQLIEYLVKLVTPKGGTVLDPFIGSGTTGIACLKQGFNFIGVEIDPVYRKIALHRLQPHLEQKHLEVFM